MSMVTDFYKLAGIGHFELNEDDYKWMSGKGGKFLVVRDSRVGDLVGMFDCMDTFKMMFPKFSIESIEMDYSTTLVYGC